MQTFRQKIADHMIEHGGFMQSRDISKALGEPIERTSKALFCMAQQDKWKMQRKEMDGKVYYKLTGYCELRYSSKFRGALESYLLRMNGSHLTTGMACQYVKDKLGIEIAPSTAWKYAQRLGVTLTGTGGRNKKQIETRPTKESLWAIALGI